MRFLLQAPLYINGIFLEVEGGQLAQWYYWVRTGLEYEAEFNYLTFVLEGKTRFFFTDTLAAQLQTSFVSGDPRQEGEMTFTLRAGVFFMF